MPRPLLLAPLLVFFALTAGPAAGHSEFQRGFYDLYIKGPEVDKDFRKLARKAKCNLCHQGKEDRTQYNRYGEALALLLSEDDKKNKKKIASALEEVAGLPSDGDGSKTFGELIAEGDLPGGSLAKSKKEPEKRAGAE